MRLLIVSLLVLIGVGQASAEEEPVYMTCNGFRPELNGPVRRQLAIYGDKAQIDGHIYRRIPNDAVVDLVGPEPKEYAEVRINPDGSYTFTPWQAPSNNQPETKLEYSRPDQGDGCKKTEKLF